VQLTLDNTNSDLEAAALNSLVSTAGLSSALDPLIGAAGFTGTNVATLLSTPGVLPILQGTGLYPLTTNAGAIATCTTATIPVGNYTGFQLALTGAHPSSISCTFGRSGYHTMLLLWAPIADPRMLAVCLEQSLLTSGPFDKPVLAKGHGASGRARRPFSIF
jgi:hypothetical protein